MNFRRAFIGPTAIEKLQKIPLNKDHSPRENEPWLRKSRDKWLIRVYEDGRPKTIASCHCPLEAVNIILLLQWQKNDIEKRIKKSRKLVKEIVNENLDG